MSEAQVARVRELLASMARAEAEARRHPDRIARVLAIRKELSAAQAALTGSASIGRRRNPHAPR
jgi:hypothetical protein